MTKHKLHVLAALTIWIMSITVICGCQILYLEQPNAYTNVLRINGEEVAVGEFQLQLQGSAAEVSSYFHQKYGVQDSKQFWMQPVHGEMPLELARDKTVEKLKKMKVEQQLMKNSGLLEDSSYQSFTDKLKDENARRAAAVAKGEVIYGPVQLNERDFLSYNHNLLMTKLYDSFKSKDVKALTTEILKPFYEELIQQGHPALLKPEQNQLEIFRIAKTDLQDGSSAKEQLKPTATALQKELATGQSTEHVLLDYKESIQLEDQYVPTAMAGSSSEKKDEVTHEGSLLKAGEVSGIIEEENGWAVLRCNQTISESNMSFEEAREDILESLYEQKAFRNWIDDQVRLAHVEIDDSVYSMIKMR